MVSASQNNCTPPGTPVEVTLARRKNASAMTITAAIKVEITVSPLMVSQRLSEPKRCQTGWCSPTWIGESSAARMLWVSPIIGVSSILRFRVHDVQSLRPDLLQHREAGSHHQQRLEDRQPEHHAQATVILEHECNDQCD